MGEYLFKEKDGRLYYCDTIILKDPSLLKKLGHSTRIRIIELLSKEPLYPAEIAKRLKMHEQNVYYHIKQLLSAGVLDVVERKEIRGTVAKKYRSKTLNFSVAMGKDWNPGEKLLSEKVDQKLSDFLFPLIQSHMFNANIVVGSPDPHGPHKARARDGHYATDLALFLGNFCNIPDSFSVGLDVDVKSQKLEAENLFIIGGPVTNLLAADLNKHFPIRFSDSKPWGLISGRKKYTDEAVGLITKIPNPHKPTNSIIYLAGIGNIGTKAAVIALSRHFSQVLVRYTGQKDFAAVVQGFDLDGDGKIDSVDVLE